jgi:truncated hemoglobin YjbI
MPSKFERLGGEAWLRPLIERFVERVYADAMIGFFFASVPRQRIVTLELQHAAEHLGKPAAYRGRPMARAHAKHAIGGGHFSRRLVILREVLQEFAVPPEVAAPWLRHQEAQRPHIVGKSGETPCPMP